MPHAMVSVSIADDWLTPWQLICNSSLIGIELVSYTVVMMMPYLTPSLYWVLIEPQSCIICTGFWAGGEQV